MLLVSNVANNNWELVILLLFVISKLICDDKSDLIVLISKNKFKLEFETVQLIYCKQSD